MKKTLERIKIDIILSAVMCVALGVVLIIRPTETVDFFCRVMAVGVILMGVVQLASYFWNKILHPYSGALGFLVLLIGVWIFISPHKVESLIPIVIGVILCLHGIQDIKLAFETHSNGYDRWWSVLIIAAISLILGVVCIIRAFGVVTLALRFIGVALIYDGISDLWVVSRAVRAVREMREVEKALEVEYKEVREDTNDSTDNESD